MHQWIIRLLWLLPKNSLSCFVGRLVAVRFPNPMRLWVLRGLVKRLGIAIQEAEKPLEAYAHFQELFTRKLKPNARPIAKDPLSWIAPCDGTLGACGTITKGTAFQIKGRPYRIELLLRNSLLARQLEEGSYLTFYLSPKDYHRFHAPCDLEIMEVYYFPGYLWPVNTMGLRHIDELFCINERVVLVCRITANHKPLVIVPVGATFVGGITLSVCPSFLIQPKPKYPYHQTYSQNPVIVSKGQELGYFSFGSTIVLLSTKETFTSDTDGILSVQVGNQLGSLIV